MKKLSFNWGSVLTGIVIGLFLGYWSSLVLVKEIGFSGPFWSIGVIILGGLIFGFLGFTTQRVTETLGYAVSGFIIFQFVWDVVMEKVVGSTRYTFFYIAIVLLLINGFTGHYTIYKGITKSKGFQVLKGALGMN